MPKDAPSPEEEYFHREDQERLRKLKEQTDRERAEAERKAARELHAGHCGKCGGQLQIKDFRGVEIDLCPDCGAVLLDPGELETLAGEDKSSGAAWFTDFFRFTKNR